MKTRLRSVLAPSLPVARRTIRASDRKGRGKESGWNAVSAQATLDRPSSPRRSDALRSQIRTQKISIKNIMDQRRFAGTGHARDTGEDAKWKVDIDIFQIVLRGAHDLDERCRFPARFR